MLAVYLRILLSLCLRDYLTMSEGFFLIKWATLNLSTREIGGHHDATKLSEMGIVNALKSLNSESIAPWDIKCGKLTKNFKFKDFQHAFAFMAMCAVYIAQKNHHPAWLNAYNNVTVQLTTHDAGGLSEKDFDLAKHMDCCTG